MDNPQDKLKFIHVAGTNGKGSTCSFINNILMSAGFKTGLYTSPFIQVFNERIRINNENISDDEIARLTSFVKVKISQMTSMGLNHPTEFEIVTAIGFLYFAQNNCDFVVLEVGLGGRLDATNIIPPPLVSVITSIGYDHIEYLGNNLQDIAFEKAGIIKTGSYAVLYPNPQPITKFLSDICKERACPYYIVDNNSINFISTNDDYQRFDYKNCKNLSINLLGKHQLSNAATAIEAINVLIEKNYSINLNHIKEGLKNTFWIGRFEIIKRDPLFIIDGAHNIDGANVLCNTLSTNYPKHKKIFIIGLLKDKDIKGILEKILEVAHFVITITPFSPRALPSSELASEIKKINPSIPVESYDELNQAILQSLKLAKSFETNIEKSLVCSCGSLYYIGEVRKFTQCKHLGEGNADTL
jgi:dihydrofolate synthase/folylpolyglutamate synthase